jgi:hypothetical protein
MSEWMNDSEQNINKISKIVLKQCVQRRKFLEYAVHMVPEPTYICFYKIPTNQICSIGT